MILFCLLNKALHNLQLALLILVKNYYCCIFSCISFIYCDFRCLLFLKSFWNVCRIILTDSFYLHFLSSWFNHWKLDRVLCFCFLDFLLIQGKSQLWFPFLEICFRNSILQAQCNEPGYTYSFLLLSFLF